jgi:hypothetical protein
MSNDTVRASATAMPAEDQEPTTLMDIEDGIDEAWRLTEAAYMAAADLPREQGSPMRTLLMIVADKLKALSEAATTLRATGGANV